MQRRHLRQRQRHRLAARLSRCAGAARPGHRTATCPGTATSTSSWASSSTPTARRIRVCPRQTLKRVLARAEKLGFQVMTGMEFEWFNFRETPQSWAAKNGVPPEPLTPGMFGYSLLRVSREPRVLQRADGRDAGLRRADRGPAHRDRARRLRGGASAFREALEQADRAILFKTGAQGDRHALRHHAELHGQVEPAVPGLQRPHPPEPVGRQGQPVLRRQERRAR